MKGRRAMTLSEVRCDIDRVDKEIKKLFEERMMLADSVARIKAETEDDIYKPDREELIISRLTGDVDGSIKMEYTALIKRIMEISRKYQYGRTLELRDCLGIKYDDREPEIEAVAMIKPELYICQGCSRDKVIAVDTYDEVYELISEGRVDAGMGILEDISYGVSDALHEMLTRGGLYIYRCSVASENGHNKKVVTFADRLIVEENHNRLKVMFVCRNRSGSLSSVLSMISDYGVNLTEIHSAPNRKQNWNYRFYIELATNFLNKDIQALVFQLMNETEEFTILGSYECHEGDD